VLTFGRVPFEHCLLISTNRLESLVYVYTPTSKHGCHTFSMLITLVQMTRCTNARPYVLPNPWCMHLCCRGHKSITETRVPTLLLQDGASAGVPAPL
jgi:hypothetical protein